MPERYANIAPFDKPTSAAIALLMRCHASDNLRMSEFSADWVRSELKRRDMKVKDLAAEIDADPNKITKSLTGTRRFTADEVMAIRDLFGAASDISRVENGEAIHVNGTLVPVYDVQASAGFGSLVDYEEQTHSLAFPPDYLRKLTAGSPKDLVIISTKGDSMEPTLLDDDIVLVDMSKTHMGYEGMFVLRHNDTLLVKRAGMAPKPGHVMLISDNKAYPPVEARLEDLHVVGKVLWYGRKV